MTESWGGRGLARSAVRATLTVLTAMAMVPQARAETAGVPAVSADYEVFAGGLHVLTGGMQVTLEDRRYDVRVDATLAGVPGWFADWWAVVESDGALAGERLDADSYSVERFRRGDFSKTALDFRGDGEVEVIYDPVRNDWNGPLPSDVLRDAVDPLSGLVAVINAVTYDGNCDLTVPVFDGRRRYDLVFTDRGTDELRPSRHSGFAGTAHRCRMQLEPVAGDFDDDEDSIWSTNADPKRRRLDMWLARPIAGGPALPVRMIGYSSLGAVVVHLRQAEAAVSTADADADTPAGCAVAC